MKLNLLHFFLRQDHIHSSEHSTKPVHLIALVWSPFGCSWLYLSWAMHFISWYLQSWPISWAFNLTTKPFSWAFNLKAKPISSACNLKAKPISSACRGKISSDWDTSPENIKYERKKSRWKDSSPPDQPTQIQGVFLTGTPPKSSKYKKDNLG